MSLGHYTGAMGECLQPRPRGLDAAMTVLVVLDMWTWTRTFRSRPGRPRREALGRAVLSTWLTHWVWRAKQRVARGPE